MSSARSPGSGEKALALLEDGRFLTRSSRQMIERFMRRWGMSAYHAVVTTQLMTEEQLADAFAEMLSVSRVFSLTHRRIDEAAAARLGFRRSRSWEMLPIINDHDDLGGLEIVVADPTQSERIAEARALLGEQSTLSVAERSDIVSAIDELYPLSAQLPTLFSTTSQARKRR